MWVCKSLVFKVSSTTHIEKRNTGCPTATVQYYVMEDAIHFLDLCNMDLADALLWYVMCIWCLN